MSEFPIPAFSSDRLLGKLWYWLRADSNLAPPTVLTGGSRPSSGYPLPLVYAIWRIT